jgi:hypothetical protein
MARAMSGDQNTNPRISVGISFPYAAASRARTLACRSYMARQLTFCFRSQGGGGGAGTGETDKMNDAAEKHIRHTINVVGRYIGISSFITISHILIKSKG